MLDGKWPLITFMRKDKGKTMATHYITRKHRGKTMATHYITRKHNGKTMATHYITRKHRGIAFLYDRDRFRNTWGCVSKSIAVFVR